LVLVDHDAPNATLYASDPTVERKKGLMKMISALFQKQISRRDMLGWSSSFMGDALLMHFFSGELLGASTAGYAQQVPSAADQLADMRARFNAASLETQKFTEDVTMFSGPGGSVVVLNGPDGKFVVDTFVAPAWPRLKKALDGLGNAPVKCVINTHWHFDHTDNNAPLHSAGATVFAHENTINACKSRTICRSLYREPNGKLSGLHFDPSPVEALPRQTFAGCYELQANGETLALHMLLPAHTNTDIYVHFEKPT
jgi:cyclase